MAFSFFSSLSSSLSSFLSSLDIFLFDFFDDDPDLGFLVFLTFVGLQCGFLVGRGPHVGFVVGRPHVGTLVGGIVGIVVG